MGTNQNVVFTHRGYTVRHWTPSDRCTAPLVAETCLRNYGIDVIDKDLEAVEVEEHFLKTGQFWVAIDDETGRLVGTCGYRELDICDNQDEEQDIDVFMDESTCTQSSRSSQSVEIRKLYLLPEARGKKLGRAMLQHLEAHICKRGYKSIYLQTVTQLVAANKLYDSEGFVELTKTEIPRILGDPRGDRIMRKMIN